MAGAVCRECGAVVEVGMSFCGMCGTRAVALPPVDELSEEPWACRGCGGANPMGTAFCGHCGARWAGTRPEDLRLVTALFADISGFTTLADTLAVEDLHDVIAPLVAGLARIAERYEGFIEKYAGDALLVVFGAPVSHEDDPQRALLTALDMQTSLPALLAQIGPAAAHLTIHIGINTGRVVAGRAGSDQQGDYAVLGDSVILAQRLESVCPAGQTYVGPTTYELCKKEFDFESVGELTLKGKLKPVEGFRLIGRRRPGTAVDRPLVGRDTELQVVGAALDATEGGAGTVIALTGEPGMGKSRLLAEVRTWATGRGMRWLAARCLSYGASLPYWPFADLLRQALGLRVEDSASVIRRRLEQALPPEAVDGTERLLGVSSTSVDPEQAKRQIHDALVTWVRSLAGSGSVVVSVEDVHWIDSASLELLAELARACRRIPAALVLSARPEGLPAIETVAADGTRYDVQVAPLGDEAVGQLVGGLLGKPAGSALLPVLVERTSGNPLFVEELSRSLAENDALLETTTTWDLKPTWDLASIPRTVENVFAARVDQLQPRLAELLQHCAVLGRTARFALLRAVLDDEDPREELEELVQAGFLDRIVESDEPGVAFHHALLHEVVYSRTLRKRRRRLHRKVADASRRLYGEGDETIDLLARHLYLAEAGEEALSPLLRAGTRAERLFANDTAVLHLTCALEVLEQIDADPAQASSVRLELARLHELRGDYDSALKLYELARDEGGHVDAWRGCASVLRKKGLVQDSLAMLEESLAHVVDGVAALWLEKAATYALAGRSEDAVDAAKAGLAICEDGNLAGELWLRLARAEEDLGRHAHALEHAERGRELFEATDNLRGLSSAYRVLAGLLRHHGRYDDAAEAARQGLQMAERVGVAEEVGGCLINLGVVDLMRGELDSAAASNERAIELFERAGHLNGRATAHVNLAETLLRMGDLQPALTHALTGLRLARSISATWTAGDAQRVLCQVYRDLGDREHAESAASEAIALFEQVGDTDSAVEVRDLVSHTPTATAQA